MSFSITKIVTVNKGPLDFYYIFLCKIFCIDMPEDGLNTGQNMWDTCNGNNVN